MNELIWIAVPGGFAEDERGTRRMILRVAVMPRLDGSTLSDAHMAEWPPPALTAATLTVDFAESPGSTVTSCSISPPHFQAQKGLWGQFFPSEMLVRSPMRRETVPGAVAVDPTTSHAEKVHSTFAECGRTEISIGSSSMLSKKIHEELAANWSGGEIADGEPSPPIVEEATPLDFQQAIGFLREHPTVLRALGLIAELNIASTDIPESLASGVVSVRWSGAPPAPFPNILSPWTRYGPEFLPRSTKNISAGMVTLTDDRGDNRRKNRWEVVTLDVNGAVARLRGAAAQLKPRPNMNVETATLPALRTAGLLLLRRGRAEDFAARRSAHEKNMRNSAEDTVLDADDLSLGYRIDVSMQGGDWSSLQRREATYTVNNMTIGTAGAEEEGHSKSHAATSDALGALRADEVVVRWNGWSLAIPQPTFDGRQGRVTVGHNALLPFQFNWHFKAPPGSLLTLRYGTQYRMRARVADVAGGGLARADKAAERCATGLISYKRYEPVASPDVRLPDGVEVSHLGPAESNTVIVIRSDEGSVDDFAVANPQYSRHTQRMLAPPQASLAVAEQHGKLDRQSDELTFEWLTRAMKIDGADAGLRDPAAGGICVFPIREPNGPRVAQADRVWTTEWPDLTPKMLSLIEGEEAGPTAMFWIPETETLVIRLAKAEQLVIELSSFLMNNIIGSFAIADIEGLPATSAGHAQQGRHPMVTPVRTVTLVHAVRRPLRCPSGKLTAERNPGETFVILTPGADPPLLGIDRKSTSQITISATWRDCDDENTQEITAAVQKVIIGRGDGMFKEELRHEFGDTRHRRVKYTVTAVSRFRQYFDEPEPPDAFLLSNNLPEVVIPNSARPNPPVILSARPSFAWEDDDEAFPGTFTRFHRRLGGLVRLEIEGPWFQTGEGERLAVLASTDGRPPLELSPFITQVGGDPIWDTPLPHRWPTRDMFANALDDGEVGLLEDVGGLVDFVSCKPFFHGGRWHVDVSLPSIAAESYCPFVRLAVARYQPNSLLNQEAKPMLDLRLSRAILSKFVPLVPPRELRVTRIGRSELRVALSGMGPNGPRHNRVDVILERAPFTGKAPRAASVISFEETGSSPLAWQAVAGEVHHCELGGEIALTIPDFAGPFRVRVREVELVGTADLISGPQTATFGELSERVVFTDTMLVGEHPER